MILFLRTTSLLLIAFVLMGQTTFPQTYYISVNSARARECAETSCRVVTSFRRGTAITVNATVQGTAVQRNTTWLEVEYNDGLVYVHSSLATTRAPANTTTNTNTSGNSSTTNTTQSTQQPISTPIPAAPGSPYTCNGRNDLNCGDFATWAQANAHFQACGDEEGLDSDNDGIVCESMR